LMIEKTLAPELRQALEARGHKLREAGSMGVSQIVARSADGKSFVGAADPRAEGTSAGW
jgi:gamma-glutamyltranspeptidase